MKKPRISAKTVGKSRPKVNPIFSEREQFKEYFVSQLIQVLDENGIPQRSRVSLLSEITGRSTQTVINWLDGANLPDLDAARRIFFKLQADSDVMLGIKRPSAQDDAANQDLNAFGIRVAPLLQKEPRLSALANAVADNPDATLLVLQKGEEMAPEIGRGETVGVDTTKTTIEASGLYVLRRRKRLFLRRVEQHVGSDYVTLVCANARYAPEQIQLSPDGYLRGVEVIGLVTFVVKKV